MMKFSWEALGADTAGSDLRDFIIEMAKHWYLYPLEVFERLPVDRYVIVKYDDLVRAPDTVVQDIYRHFGFEPGEGYARFLRDAAHQARDYTSRHKVSLAELGLSRDELINEFRDIIDRFGFEV